MQAEWASEARYIREHLGETCEVTSGNGRPFGVLGGFRLR